MNPKIVNLTVLVSWCASLAGCGTAPPATQQISIPVFTPCVKKAIPKPIYDFDKLPADAADGAKVLALAKDWPRGRKYEGQLEAVIAGCS